MSVKARRDRLDVAIGQMAAGSELTPLVRQLGCLRIRGGENIHPREIEEFLYTHSRCRGRPGHRRTRREVRQGALHLDPEEARRQTLDADAVHEFATGKLAHYKIPRYVLVVDEFPMTVTGKVRKVEQGEKSAARLGLTTGS